MAIRLLLRLSLRSSAMTHSEQHAVDEKLAVLRRRVMSLVWWSGVSLTVAVLLACLMTAGLLDRWFDDTGLRWLLAIGVWTGVALATWRFLIAPLRLSLTDVFLASQIERRYPGLAGRLSAAMSFRTTGCQPRMGSPALQQLVVGQAWNDLRAVDPRDIIEPRKIRPALLGGMSACLVTAMVLWSFPLHAGTALKRLAFPWANYPWPRVTALRIVNADGKLLPTETGAELRSVRGSVLDYTVENVRGKLPDEVWLETRTEGQPRPVRELLRRTTRSEGQSKPRPVAALSLPATRGPIEFRAVGGDDDLMPWHRLEIVEPPTLTDFSLAIQPPAYLNLPEESLPRGAIHASGLIGSQVTFAAKSSKPLKKVELRRREGASIPVTLAENRTDFHTTVTIEQAGAVAVWFQLVDDEGFSEPEPLQFELRGQLDAVPEVTLREPATDLFVTPDAEVNLAVDLADDWGLVAARLTWQRENETTEQRPLETWTDRRRQAVLETPWELAELALKPGDRLMYRVEADDICNLNGPHTGKSAPRMLVVVSKEEKRQDLAARIGEIVEDLQQAHEQQTRLRQQTADLLRQMNDVGELRPEDKDGLHRLEIDQRQLSQQLTETTRGIAARARQLRQDFPINKLDDEETEANLEQLADGLDKLDETALTKLARELTQANKIVESQPVPTETTPPAETPKSAEAASALDRAGRIQDDVLQSLDDWQKQFSEWRNDRALAQQLESLLKEQADINKATSEIGTQTVGKSAAELSPQQRTDLQKLSMRQRQQAQRLDQFEGQLRDQSEALEDEQPAAAAQLLDAADQLKEGQTGAKLRQASDDLAANRLGEAAAAQRSAEELLKKTQDEWKAEPTDDTEQLVKRIDQAQTDAEEIAEGEEQLRKKTEAAAQDGMTSAEKTELRDEAARLRRKLQKLERQLQRLRLKPAADAARRASERLQTAEQNLEEGEPGDEAMESIEEAGEDIEQLQDELADAEKEAAEQLAQEDFEKLTAKIDGLKQRQEAVIAETTRLEDERVARGQWTRGQLRSLKELAEIEKELHTDLAEVQTSLASTAVVKKALEFAERDLRRAAVRLDARQTDRMTQELERQVAKRFDQLLSAWNAKPSAAQEPKTNENDATPEESNEPKPAGPPGENLPQRLELQLLRDMQADCLERTKAWERQRIENGKLTDEETIQVQELAAEQGELAALAEQLIESFTRKQAPPVNAPETQP